MNPRTTPPPAVYTAIVSYEMPSLAEGKRRTDNIPYWAANDAEALRDALTRGAAKVATLLKRQLEEGADPFKPVRGENMEKRVIKAFNGPSMKVQVLESGPDGELVRLTDGSLRFLARPMAAAGDVEPSGEPSGDMPTDTPEKPSTETPEESLAEPSLQG